MSVRAGSSRSSGGAFGRGADLLGRLGAALVQVALTALAAYVFLAALDVLKPTGPAASLLGSLAQRSWPERLIVAGVAVLVGLMAALSLLSVGGGARASEDTPRGGKMGVAHILAQDERGLVILSGRSIASIVGAAAHATPGVLSAEVREISKPPAAVRARVRVQVYVGSEVTVIGEAVRDNVRSAVERLAGLPTGPVTVEVEVTEARGELRMVE